MSLLAALLIIQFSAVQATEDSNSMNEALDGDAARKTLLAEPDPADLIAQVNDGDRAFVSAERAEGENAHINWIAITACPLSVPTAGRTCASSPSSPRPSQCSASLPISASPPSHRRSPPPADRSLGWGARAGAGLGPPQ